MIDYKNFEQNKIIEQTFYTKNSIKYWKNSLKKAYAGQIDTWDYQLTSLILKKG